MDTVTVPVDCHEASSECYYRAAVFNLFGTRGQMEDNFSTDGPAVKGWGVEGAHAQLTIGFTLLRESHVATDLTGGGPQAVM